jgi:phage portal protein BeeE
MSWRDRLAAWLTKALPTPPASAVIAPGQPHWSQWSYQAFASEAYRGNPWVYRAFRGIITAMAGIEVTAKRQAGDDLDDLEPGHPLARLIAAPTSLYGWSSWVERMTGYYLLGGQAHAIAVAPETGSSAGMPLQLIPVQPSHVHPIPGELLG